tara:strand:- start:1541 stop:1885 length:345 start_codon:yes stop_codon:yes gene_type:complete
MKQFQEKTLPFITAILLCCTFLYTCSTNRTTDKVLKSNVELVLTVDSLTQEVKTLSDSTISISDIELRLELEGYKVSARNLYYNNAIIRTKERPDDIMYKYNQEIEKLTKKIKK